MKAPILHSTNITLEPLCHRFCTQKYVDWMNDPDIFEYLETGGDYTLEKLHAFLNDVEKADIFFWAISLKHNHEHIGNIKIDPVDAAGKSGEYGIMMGEKNEWGKGYAKEASELVIDYCFNTLQLNAITLGVIKENKPAIGLYDKLGFEIEVEQAYYGKHKGKYNQSLRMILRNKKNKN